MTLPSSPRILRKADSLACYPLENGLVVGLPSSQQVLVFNQTAHTIWEILDGISVQALLLQLSEKYGLADTALEMEILPFLEKLITAGLITEDEPTHV